MKSFSFPKGLWFFFSTSFHVALLAHDGTTFLGGEAKFTIKIGLTWYNTKR